MERERLERKTVWSALFILDGLILCLVSEYLTLNFNFTSDGTLRIAVEEGMWANVFLYLSLIFTFISAFFFFAYLYRMKKNQWISRNKKIDFKDVLFYLALFQVGIGIINLLILLLPDTLVQEITITSIVLLFLGHIFMLIAAFYLFKGRLSEIGFVKPQKWYLFVPLAVIFLLISNLWVAFVHIPMMEWLNVESYSWRDSLIFEVILKAKEMGFITGLFSVVMIGLFVPIAEETMFRGVLQTKLTQKFGPFLSILLTSFIFAIYHVDLVSFAVIFIMGLLLGWLRYYFKSVWPAILLHALRNTIAALFIFFQ